VQGVELEYLLKGVELPLEGDHGEAGQVLVFVEIDLEGGEQLPRFHQGVVLFLEIGPQQAMLDMLVVDELLEFLKGFELDAGFVFPFSLVARSLAECFFPHRERFRVESKKERLLNLM
jgi:hypothetical protein